MYLKASSLSTHTVLLSFLIAIVLIVFVHELGHFIFARLFGVEVETFSIGFGPRIFGAKDRKGTLWQVAWLPLGGYVKMRDDPFQPGHTKPPLQKMLIAFAGPLFNFLFAFALFFLFFSIKGIPEVSSQILDVQAHTPAERIGLQKGDKILKINHVDLKDFDRTTMAGKEIHLTIERDGQSKEQSVTLVDDDGKPVSLIGVVFDMVFKKSDIGTIAKMSMLKIAYVCYDIVHAIVRKSDQIGGIFSVVHAAKGSMQSGVPVFILFMGMLSVNLGLVNLLPIPLLDGGHIFMALLECVRGKPMTQRIHEALALAGFLGLVCIMIFATWNDLSRLGVLQWLLQYIKGCA